MPNANTLLRHGVAVALSAKALILIIGICMFWAHGASLAQKPIRIGIFETMGYPFNQFDAKNHLSGGLLKDVGDSISMQLGATPSYFPLPRKRVDQWLESGKIDVVCYTNPKWTDSPERFSWSTTILPQIERVVTRSGLAAPVAKDDFLDKRISLQLGFHYESIQPLFDSGKAIRLNETNLGLMFKAVEVGVADALISSEGEIEGYFKEHPEKRQIFEISKSIFSNEETSCAISKKSSWNKAAIDKAIWTLERRGEFARVAKSYGMSSH